jgi:hypothetical protein
LVPITRVEPFRNERALFVGRQLSKRQQIHGTNNAGKTAKRNGESIPGKPAKPLCGCGV